MDFIPLFVVLSFVIFSGGFYVLRSNSKPRKSSKLLPPGPYPFPIFGNILQLIGQNLHTSLAKLSKIYGPLMYLKLGSVNTIVVSSPDIAKQVLQKHDQIFSGRFISIASQAHDHHKMSIGYLPAENKWRNIRKICREQMFSMPRLDASQGHRLEKLRKMCDYVEECSVNGRIVDVGEVAYVTSSNMVSATLFSIEFAQFDSDSTQEIRKVIEGFLEVIGTPNLADFFPVLKVIDPQGIKRKSEFYTGKLLAIFEDIINQRVRSRGDYSSRKDDLLDALVDPSKVNEYNLSDGDIKHLFLDLLVAGTDTTADSVHWAMTELLRNPKKMSKVKDELQAVVGKDNEIEESDISRLPYLHAVVKETLRMYPAGPLLIPHKAEIDIEINGYMVPKNAQVLVNAWAIGRCPSSWSNPNSFEPERFIDNNIHYKGQDFELIPFESGRRLCPGLPLAHRMVHLMLASLIHKFDWKLEPGVKPEEMDISEKFGITLHKAVPLKAVPIKL